MEKEISEKAALKKIAAIEDSMHLAREKVDCACCRRSRGCLVSPIVFVFDIRLSRMPNSIVYAGLVWSCSRGGGDDDGGGCAVNRQPRKLRPTTNCSPISTWSCNRSLPWATAARCTSATLCRASTSIGPPHQPRASCRDVQQCPQRSVVR